jgi:glutamyl-tRNA reductase
VRAETGLGRAPTSAAGIAAQKLRKHFGPEGPGVSVFVGAGEMTRKVAQALAGRPGERLFVNRTRARAEELARRFGGEARSLDELLAAPPARVDLLFSATTAGRTVVPASALEPALAARPPQAPPIIVCDLAVPRDVDPALDARPGVRVVDMVTIEALARQDQAAHEGELARARALVDREVAHVVREARFEELAAESARAVLAGPLSHLAPADRDVVRRYVVGLATRMARQPAAR